VPQNKVSQNFSQENNTGETVVEPKTGKIFTTPRGYKPEIDQDGNLSFVLKTGEDYKKETTPSLHPKEKKYKGPNNQPYQESPLTTPGSEENDFTTPPTNEQIIPPEKTSSSGLNILDLGTGESIANTNNDKQAERADKPAKILDQINARLEQLTKEQVKEILSSMMESIFSPKNAAAAELPKKLSKMKGSDGKYYKITRSGKIKMSTRGSYNPGAGTKKKLITSHPTAKVKQTKVHVNALQQPRFDDKFGVNTGNEAPFNSVKKSKGGLNFNPGALGDQWETTKSGVTPNTPNGYKIDSSGSVQGGIYKHPDAEVGVSGIQID